MGMCQTSAQTDFHYKLALLSHGGNAVSLFLHQNLHGIFESVDKSQIPELYAWMKELGGYYKRHRGGVLQPWLTRPPSEQKLDLEARATLAFLEVCIAKSYFMKNNNNNLQ